ncbi:hypothetical protein LTR84_009159 [Exophiala bonariae]|uniref:Methyltransferase domain-containing protein n=1 Tax=Exophiala bonariae TaxID=1690606 RepID=A0AAV9MVQ1_9EURO|nr:hypothetical protein LTR84_009159 [Exophiala bonariae]
MAPGNHPGNYTQGYSQQTLSSHLLRTAETDAAFLLPHIKKHHKVLDVGCGPGTISLGFVKYASEGTTVGIDISAEVLEKAKSMAAEAEILNTGPGSISFEAGDILSGLSYADNSFDIVYCGQVLGYFVESPDLPVQALTEMRRVLKPGGILATRTGAEQHFYPRSFDLDRLWVRNFERAVYKGVVPAVDSVGNSMPGLFRKAGFDLEIGGIHVSAGTTVYSTPEARKWLALRGTSQLQPGDAFHQSWLDADITNEEIEQTLKAVAEWAEHDGAWFVALHCDVLGWK